MKAEARALAAPVPKSNIFTREGAQKPVVKMSMQVTEKKRTSSVTKKTTSKQGVAKGKVEPAAVIKKSKGGVSKEGSAKEGGTKEGSAKEKNFYGNERVR